MLSAHTSRFARGKKPFQPLMAKPHYHWSYSVTTQVTEVKSLAVLPLLCFAKIKLGKPIYWRLIKRVLERDGWRCQKSGALENLQVHHRIKRSQQGDDALANLVTLCAHCHMAEHGQLFYSVPTVRICSKPKARPK